MQSTAKKEGSADEKEAFEQALKKALQESKEAEIDRQNREAEARKAWKESKEAEEDRQKKEGEVLQKVNKCALGLAAVHKAMMEMQQGGAVADADMERYLVLFAQKEKLEREGLGLLAHVYAHLEQQEKRYADAMQLLLATLGEAVPCEVRGIFQASIAEEEKKSVWKQVGIAPALFAALEKEVSAANLECIEREWNALLPAIQKINAIAHSNRTQYAAMGELVDLKRMRERLSLLEQQLKALEEKGRPEAESTIEAVKKGKQAAKIVMRHIAQYMQSCVLAEMQEMDLYALLQQIEKMAAISCIREYAKQCVLEIVEAELPAWTSILQVLTPIAQSHLVSEEERAQYAGLLEEVECGSVHIYLLEGPLIKLARQGHAHAVMTFIEQDFIPVDFYYGLVDVVEQAQQAVSGGMRSTLFGGNMAGARVANLSAYAPSAHSPDPQA